MHPHQAEADALPQTTPTPAPPPPRAPPRSYQQQPTAAAPPTPPHTSRALRNHHTLPTPPLPSTPSLTPTRTDWNFSRSGSLKVSSPSRPLSTYFLLRQMCIKFSTRVFLDHFSYTILFYWLYLKFLALVISFQNPHLYFQG